MRHTILAALLLAPLIGLPATGTPRPARPNILIAIADDLSHVHTSFAGYPGVKTPALDRVAREGVYFRNAFAPTPGCSPTRASFLTGRHPWQIEQAGTHASSFPAKYVAFPDLLEHAGYFIGMTGKGWSPGDLAVRDVAGVRTPDVVISAVQVGANYPASLWLRRFLRERALVRPADPLPADLKAGLAALGLSARESDVVELLLAGLSHKEIAERLSIAPETVKNTRTTRTGSWASRTGCSSATSSRTGCPGRGLE